MESKLAYLSEKDLQKIAIRPERSHKGTFGKLLVIAGGKGMAGAAILCGKAAYRNGVGLVKIYTCETNAFAIHTALPEAIVSTFPEKSFEEVDEQAFLTQVQWADAIVIGPGLGISEITYKVLSLVCQYATCPVLFDADALNMIAKTPDFLQISHKHWIFTPHLGEFSRLTGQTIEDISERMPQFALQYAQDYNVTCVLKDAHSIIAGLRGEVFINYSGNNGMATAGSGDVLSGIIGAFLAQKLSDIDAATYGAFIHGLAGDAARRTVGTHAMMASDIINGLIEVWSKVENK